MSMCFSLSGGLLSTCPRELGCDTGVVWKSECRRIKGNQITFDNSQRNNLRSCVWVSVVVFVKVLVLMSSWGEKSRHI